MTNSASRFLIGVLLTGVLVGCGSSSRQRSPAAVAAPSTPTTNTAGAPSGSGAVVQDAETQALARTAQTAAETIGVDNNGSYAGVTPGAIARTEPSIRTAASGKPYLSAAHGTATGYTITATSPTGDTFTITRRSGSISRSCTGHVPGVCHNGTW